MSIAAAGPSSIENENNMNHLLLNIDFDEMIDIIETDGKLAEEIISVCEEVGSFHGKQSIVKFLSKEKK